MKDQQALGHRRIVWRALADMVGWFAVLVVAATAQSLAMTEGFGIDPRRIDYSDWRLYLTEYLMPLVSLPLLTLRSAPPFWSGLPRRPCSADFC